MYIFQPNVPLSIYQRRNLPRLYGAAWLPRRHPKNRSVVVDWQALSTLYFLTEEQVNTETEIFIILVDHIYLHMFIYYRKLIIWVCQIVWTMTRHLQLPLVIRPIMRCNTVPLALLLHNNILICRPTHDNRSDHWLSVIQAKWL